jgi:hypothetical protein
VQGTGESNAQAEADTTSAPGNGPFAVGAETVGASEEEPGGGLVAGSTSLGAAVRSGPSGGSSGTAATSVNTRLITSKGTASTTGSTRVTLGPSSTSVRSSSSSKVTPG